MIEKRLADVLIYLVATLSFQASWAAPFPATSSSVLTTPEKGIYYSSQGFRLGTEGTSWFGQQRGSENENSWNFSHDSFKSARVQVKTDVLATEMSLEAYARRWMRDYHQLGMDVLGTKSFSTENNRGVVIDIIHAKKKIQIRQVVFLKKKKVVVLTCSDEQKLFERSLPECNRLIKNFSWVQLTHELQKK